MPSEMERSISMKGKRDGSLLLFHCPLSNDAKSRDFNTVVVTLLVHDGEAIDIHATLLTSATIKSV